MHNNGACGLGNGLTQLCPGDDLDHRLTGACMAKMLNEIASKTESLPYENSPWSFLGITGARGSLSILLSGAINEGFE